MAVDYDPIKAHEYYEKHKKLKGRRSTRKFTETQKAQWEYAKDQLAQEHKEINTDIAEDAKEKRAQLSERAKSVISALRNRLKALPKEQRAKVKEQIQGLISDVREKLKSDKADVTGEAKEARADEKVAYEKRKDEAYDKIKG